MLVSAFIHVTGGITSYFSSLYLLPIIAASTVRFRRGALQVADAQRDPVPGPGHGAVPSTSTFRSRARFSPVVDLPTAAVRAIHGCDQPWRVLRRRAPGRIAGGKPSFRRCAARGRVASRFADLRAFNEYVIDSLLSGLVTADSDGRILTFNRAASTITGLPAVAGDRRTTSSTCCRCPPASGRGSRRSTSDAAVCDRSATPHADGRIDRRRSHSDAR